MNPSGAYLRSRILVTPLRLASWRQVVKGVACPACGAAEGRACQLGQEADCAQCGRIASCATGARVHRARLDAWLRPQAPR